MKSAMTLRCSLGIIGMMTLAACSGEAAQDTMPPPPAVSVAPVPLEEVAHWDEFTGHIEAVEAVALRPRVSGYIERVTYIEGGEVSAGDVLFVIDQRPYRTALQKAEAELERARARARLARAEAERAERLLESQAISTEMHGQRRAAAAEADAGVRAAESAVADARLDLAFTEVRAPISGRAGRAHVTAGNLVDAQPNATLLTTIVSTDPVHVHFDADEHTFLRYHELARNGRRRDARDPSHPVRVQLASGNGATYEGRLDFIDNELDTRTGTIRARAVLANPDGALTPGLFARVQLLGSERYEALLVDERAVLTDQDRQYVHVVDDEGRAFRRDVTLGRRAEGLRVVTSGLEPGDRVIVHGVQKVFFSGMEVDPQIVSMGDPPAAAGASGSAAN